MPAPRLAQPVLAWTSALLLDALAPAGMVWADASISTHLLQVISAPAPATGGGLLSGSGGWSTISGSGTLDGSMSSGTGSGSPSVTNTPW